MLLTALLIGILVVVWRLYYNYLATLQKGESDDFSRKIVTRIISLTHAAGSSIGILIL